MWTLNARKWQRSDTGKIIPSFVFLYYETNLLFNVMDQICVIFPILYSICRLINDGFMEFWPIIWSEELDAKYDMGANKNWVAVRQICAASFLDSDYCFGFHPRIFFLLKMNSIHPVRLWFHKFLFIRWPHLLYYFIRLCLLYNFQRAWLHFLFEMYSLKDFL